MNKSELINIVNETTGIYKNYTKEVLEVAFDTIVEAMKRDEEVSIYKFGKFKPVIKSETRRRDINTGEMITVPEHRTMKFIPGGTVKDEIYNV